MLTHRHLFILSALALCLLAGAARPNLLENGNFARLAHGVPVDWGLWPGAKGVKLAKEHLTCLQISSDFPQYAIAVQYLPFDAARVRRVRLSGRVSYAHVRRGAQEDDKLKAFVVWYNRNGRQLNTADAGTWTGSGGWRRFSAVMAVPAGTVRAGVFLGLQDCSGFCRFADLVLTVEAGDATFNPRKAAQTDTRGWWKFTAAETPAAGTVLDVSALLDAPAGKHGFLTARDGHFFFQDGTRARFWGFDIMGGECFPNHATARRLAARLSRMGANIVRLHHMDAWWATPNMFDPHYPDTQHLSPSSLERLDYFMAQLKQRGIYIYFDWLVNRKFKRGDAVPAAAGFEDGAKIVAHFDPHIINLQRKYMAQVLAHRNAYTGLRYADEPQIALSEVINEDSLFYEDWYDKVPPRYLRELTACCRRYEAKANPAHHPFDAPTLRALYRIESGYFSEMRAYLKKLGLRCPTTGSNHWENMGPAMLCDAATDYIDRHYYWDHPKVDFGWDQEFDNLPMLADYDGGLLHDIAGSKVAGKPMVVTEWCLCWLNDTIAEGPLVGAAYADLQDWDVMIWFDIDSAAPDSAMDNEFDIADKPHLFAQWTAAALLFHRRDLPPFARVSTHRTTRAALLAGQPLDATLNHRLALSARVETAITAQPAAKSVQPAPPHAAALPAVWDDFNGTLNVRSSATVALDGFIGGHSYDLGWANVRVDSPFCALWCTALDGQPLATSHHLLITAAARAENSGARYSTARTRLLKPGTAPLRIEPVHAAFTFPAEVTICPLNTDGTPRAAVKTQRLELGKDRTFWYELRR